PERGEEGRVRTGRIAEPDQEGDRADEVHAEQEAGDVVERTNALACGALQLLVVDTGEILHQQVGEGRALVHLPHFWIHLSAKPRHRESVSGPALKFV